MIQKGNCLVFLLILMFAFKTISTKAQKAHLFAPDIISTGNENDELFPTFSPDGNTIYFARRIQDGQFTIYYSKLEGEKWSSPQIASFSGEYSDQEPFISPEGTKLFFTSNRPFKVGEPPIAGRDLWYVEKTHDEWGEPVHIGDPISLPPTIDENVSRFFGLARGPMVDAEGTLYFWAERPEDKFGLTDIYRSVYKDGKYQDPINLGSEINGEHYETTMDISSDGRYMFLARDGYTESYGVTDIYISYKNNKKWTEPENCGEIINSEYYDFSPRFHPNEKLLFFSSNRNVEGEGSGKQNIYYIELEELPCLQR